MIEKTQKSGCNILFDQGARTNTDECDTAGVNVYSQGEMVIADLRKIKSLSFISVYDDKGIIVKTVKSHGMEVIEIKVPKKGVNQVQIQNGTHLFIQELMLH